MRVKKLTISSLCVLLLFCLCAFFASCSNGGQGQCSHEFGEMHAEIKATCLENGVKAYKTCSLCGKNFDENGNEITDLTIIAGHSFGEWEKIQKATTESEGLAKRICSECGTEEEKVLPVIVEAEFTISYDLNGGSIYSETQNPVSYKNTDDDILIANPYKSGYVFLGWADGDKTSQIDYKIESGTEKNLTLVADYKKDSTKFYQGANIDVTPSAVRKYLDSSNQAEYLYTYENSYNQAKNPSAISLSWTNVYANKPYKIEIANDENFENVCIEQTKNYYTARFYNLIPDTYYYRVTDSVGNVVKIDYFTITEKLRTIYCGNISNMRDEGGKTTADGVTKYGLIYRAPEIANANDDAIDVLVNQLGIKTEIDLRLDSTTSTVDPSIKKYVLGIVQWDYLFPGMNSNRPHSSILTENLKKIFKLFADKSNYPIVFHCSAGADRTGTLGFLLNALLGASYDELAADFEITSFYYGGRWRSNIVLEDGEYKFDDSGAMCDNENNLVSFDRVYKYVMQTYGTEGGTLSEAVSNYLKTVVGLSDAELSAIKHIMIGAGDHNYGEWTVYDGGSCQRDGESRRYCSCGEYETQILKTNGEHVFGAWTVVTEASLSQTGVKERYCECGVKETADIPMWRKIVFDFNGEDFDASVKTPEICNRAASAVAQNSSYDLPDGYSDGVYAREDSDFIAVGIGFNEQFSFDAIKSIVVKMYVSASSLKKGNFRLYDDKNNNIRADKNYYDLASNIYGEWVEIDILPLIESAEEYFVKDGILQKVNVILRTGDAAVVAFDSVTVVVE